MTWYSQYGYSSQWAMLKDYPNCPVSTLCNSCLKFAGDKSKLDTWYANYKPYRSKKRKQTEEMKFIRSHTGLYRGDIQYDLDAGYTKEEIILASKNNIQVRYIKNAYTIDNKLYTLYSYAKAFKLAYRRLLQLRRKIGEEGFKIKLEAGEFLNEK